MESRVYIGILYILLAWTYVSYISRRLPSRVKCLALVGGFLMQALIGYVLMILPLKLSIVFLMANVACWMAMLWSERRYGIVMLGKRI